MRDKAWRTLRALYRHGDHVHLTLVVIAAYWVAWRLGCSQLELVLGGALTFYIPGSLILGLTGKMFEAVHHLERLAVSVLLSIAFIAGIALILDWTPWGVHQETLALAITGLNVGCLVVSRSSHGTKAKEHGANVWLVVVMVSIALWAWGMPLIGAFAMRIDGWLTPRPPQGYAAISGSCKRLPRNEGYRLEGTVTNHTGRDQDYQLWIEGDTRAGASYGLRVGAGTSSTKALYLRPGWSRLTAALMGRGMPRIVLSPGSCK